MGFMMDPEDHLLKEPFSRPSPTENDGAIGWRSTKDVETVPLLDETVQLSKRDVVTGSVRVSTRTEIHDDVAEVMLDRDVVDVTRVAIGRVVDMAPGVRTEGDTIIVPVIEERLVIVKQLYLTEELHIRRHVEQESSRTPVQLRRQHAVIEKLDATGAIVDGSSSQV